MKVVTPQVASPPEVARLDFLVGGGYGSLRAAISTSYPDLLTTRGSEQAERDLRSYENRFLLVVVLRDLYLRLSALEQVSLNADRG